VSADIAVSAAVEAYLEGLEVDGQEEVLAEVARALAGQLDHACASGTARGLSAAPPLARRLVEVMREVAAREAEKAEEAMRAERREQRRRDATWARNGGAVQVGEAGL
jgi:hypothetical protein